jgi:hypothetical protein
MASPNVADIKQGIKTIFELVTTPEPGVQNVEIYRRAFKDADDFVRNFEVRAPGGGKMLNAWIMEPPAAVTDPLVQSGHYQKTWTYTIVGYMSLNDKLRSEDILDRIMENIEDKVLQDETGYTLDGSVRNVVQVRTSQDPPVFFGRYLTNICTVELDVITHRQYC